MRRLSIILTFIFACVILPPASAQTTDAGYDTLSSALAKVAKTMNATIRRNLADAAEEMPANEYAFRPTPQVRTFGQLVGHLTEAIFFFCSQAAGKKYPVTTNYEQITGKVMLVKDLNDSLTYCDAVYAATTDANFLRPVKVSYGPDSASSNTVRGAVLMLNVAHQRALRQHRRLHATKRPCSAVNGSCPAAKEVEARWVAHSLSPVLTDLR